MSSSDEEAFAAHLREQTLTAFGMKDWQAREPDGSGLVPWPDGGIEVFDMVLPSWLEPAERWTPFRNVFARWHSGKVCYPLPSGNMVHVKPDCRC